jgi:hypothetical protein
MIFGENVTSELKWQSVRGSRNRLLAESDWTQLQDSASDKQAWASYRNLLRNIPQDFSTPESIVWPEKPQ